MKITARFRLQLLIQNGLFVALILGIATVLLIAAEKSNMRWDMTYSQRNTLSSETLDILQKIQRTRVRPKLLIKLVIFLHHSC